MSQIKDIWLYAHHMLRSSRQIINDNLRPLNLTSAEGNILIHLLTQGEEIGQEQLVEQLDISKPAVSRALNSLQKKGYVNRERDPHDKRAHRVRLTDNAREVGPIVEQTYNQIYAIAIQGITEEELNYFINLLSRMSENFVR